MNDFGQDWPDELSDKGLLIEGMRRRTLDRRLKDPTHRGRLLLGYAQSAPTVWHRAVTFGALQRIFNVPDSVADALFGSDPTALRGLALGRARAVPSLVDFLSGLPIDTPSGENGAVPT